MFNVLLQQCIFFRLFQIHSLTLETSCREDRWRRKAATGSDLAGIDQNNALLAIKQEDNMSKVTGSVKEMPEGEPPSCPLPRFQFSESDIKFVGLIGEGGQAMVFRIACGGKTFACKIHKYKDLQVDVGIYPRPNISFNKEALAYARTSQLQNYEIPRCYGYVEFTRIPQLEHREHKDPHQPSGRTLPLYVNFAVGGARHSTNLLQYFQNAPYGSCILRGIILEEICNARSLCKNDLFLGGKLANLGVEILKKLHNCRVVHHDLLNPENTLVVPNSEGGERVMLLDFSLAEFAEDFRPERFERMAQGDIKDWLSPFFSYTTRD